MDNSSPQQPPSADNQEPTTPASRATGFSRGMKTIQPLSTDLQPTSTPTQAPVQTTTPQPMQSQPTQNTQQEPEHGLGKPVDPSKIYPDISQPFTPTNPSSNPNQPDTKLANSQRVASRVPSVQVYAFLIMIYSAYSLIALSSIFHTTKLVYSGGHYTTTSALNLTSPVLLLAFGVAAVNIAVGIYLLIAKNIKTVSALLTALLIIGGINLLNSIVNLAHYIAHVSANSIVSLFISIGLLMYLWSVKSQVDLASI